MSLFIFEGALISRGHEVAAGVSNLLSCILQLHLCSMFLCYFLSNNVGILFVKLKLESTSIHYNNFDIRNTEASAKG